MIFHRFVQRAVLNRRVGSRSAFTSSKRDPTNPDWLGVGLAFASSAFIWGLLFKQHSTYLHEYKVSNGLEE